MITVTYDVGELGGLHLLRLVIDYGIYNSKDESDDDARDGNPH